jgi:hypothetical protein
MTDLAAASELAARIQRLEDGEAVKQAMHRYWRCLDHKLFDELGDCFTEDVEADYGMPGWSASGRDALVAFLSANEGGDLYQGSHAGHNTEVTVRDDTTAHGFFHLHDWVTISGRTVMRGFGQYDMLFRRDPDGRWRIRVMNLHYIYREEHHHFLNNVPVPLTPALGDAST